MAKREIKVIYYFTSSKADGDDYTRELIVKAENEKAALTIAKFEGFSAFGERFNDNCYDWRVAA